MSVLVAVPDSAEGTAALVAAAQEAEMLGTDLVILNLALKPLDRRTVPAGATVVERSGPADRDPVDAVLDEIAGRTVDRLVIGVRRRSRVGKAFIGSISSRLLMESPVPVLAVKLPVSEHHPG
ncbi:universal stress protein [Nakamurella sp. YIM 132087]|uniref:Universal stress protein n=1 Tax=Nakamurella alba TaxID=2665158 RepID=A0A7K1FKV0_9ACTN|nr:universal stress protein [Nakamurella alba]MTD14765.1 universal stress protein [Nakamurella alba]